MAAASLPSGVPLEKKYTRCGWSPLTSSRLKSVQSPYWKAPSLASHVCAGGGVGSGSPSGAAPASQVASTRSGGNWSVLGSATTQPSWRSFSASTSGSTGSMTASLRAAGLNSTRPSPTWYSVSSFGAPLRAPSVPPTAPVPVSGRSPSALGDSPPSPSPAFSAPAASSFRAPSPQSSKSDRSPSATRRSTSSMDGPPSKTSVPASMPVPRPKASPSSLSSTPTTRRNSFVPGPVYSTSMTRSSLSTGAAPDGL